VTTHAVRIPDVGEGIAEVELVAWLVAEGQAVTRNEMLAEVMTEKANVEIPSPVEGTVTVLNGEIGQKLAVGSILVELALAAGAQAPPSSVSASGPSSSLDARPVSVSGPAGGPVPSSALASPGHAGAPARLDTRWPRPPGERPRATPAVRYRARQAGVDLHLVTGTGPAGRITHDDLDAYFAMLGAAELGFAEPGPAEPRAAAPAPAAVRLGAAEPGAAPVEPQVDDRAGVGLGRDRVLDTPVIGIRRRIAERMVAATTTIPHITYVEEVDVTALEELRAALNERRPERVRLTVLPFVARALVVAIRSFPGMNAHFIDDLGPAGHDGAEPAVLRTFGAVHVGIATQTPNGLVVPVIDHAEVESIWGLADRIAAQAEAARQGRATPDDLRGSTITITSLGPLGGLVTTPVINKPEVAIVGVNKIVTRPVWDEGAFVPRQMMNLSSSFDHRVIDGWDAASFIQEVRALLEQPALLFVDDPEAGSPLGFGT
jgi:2-oxoisovalerate dehydrogenase E2 component (dihydrolipoyl transacylase)